MKKILLLIIFNCFIIKVLAQSFYVSDSELTTNGFAYFIHKITITATGIQSDLMTDCGGQEFFSIAANSKKIFWVGSNHLFSGDINGNSISNCTALYNLPTNPNALTLGSDNNVYYSGNYLYKTDLTTGKTVNSKSMLNYIASGDLTFYNGDLYMATSSGIAKIDVNDPSKSYIYMQINIPNIYGLVSVSTSLHKNTVYAMANSGFQTVIYELDLDNKQVVKQVGTLPYQVLDAASPVEDGSIAGIQINKVNVHQNCSAPTTGIAEVITLPHTDEFTFKLNNGSTNTNGMFTGLAPGNYTVTVTSSVDVQTANFTVPVYSLTKPVYNYDVKNQNCDVAGSISFSTPDANTNYQISFNNNIFPLNHIFTDLTTGDYEFKVLNDAGCEVDHITINVPRTKCVIQFDKIAINQQCDAFHKAVLTTYIKPHNQPYTFTLNQQSNTTGIFSNLSTGNYSLKITSAEDELILPVSIPDYKALQPAITYNVIQPFCTNKGSIQFDIDADKTQYQIQMGSVNMPFDHVFDNLDPGVYHFTILTLTGCLFDSFDIELKYKPCSIVINNISFSAECNVLAKEIVRVVCDPTPETYSYTLDNQSNSTGIFNMIEPGTHTLTVSASGGAQPQQRILLVPDPSLNKPSTIVNKKNPVCSLAGSINFTIGGQSISNFNIGYQNQVYPSNHTFNLNAGDYHFSILKNDGCIVDALDISLEQESCNPVSFPSAFTPNNDGINDLFRADQESKALNFNLKIYDRWGMLVYFSKDIYQGWDGNFKGKAVSASTYYWLATYIDQENKPITQKGSVTLIR